MDAITYCRICSGTCGMIVTIADGKAVSVRADRDNPVSNGFMCIKGLQNADFHHGSDRIRHPHKRRPDGGYDRIGSEQAIEEISAATARLIERHGPRAIGMFIGTQAAFNVALQRVATAFMAAIGSPNLFGTMTIDQSAKWIAEGRMGKFLTGRPAFDSLDTMMVVGSNPLVSLSGGQLGMPTYDPVKAVKEAKRRGLKLIVVDPVRNQLAQQADLYLPIVPGQDGALFAAMLRLIIDQDWHDTAFCARYANGLERLRAIVEPFTLDYAAQRTGLPATDIRRAAEMFARDAKRGQIGTGTGPDMAAHSNVTEHLAQALNAICGYFAREGDTLANPGVIGPERPAHAEVIPPNRTWEHEPKTLATGYGPVYGQMMSGVLPEEILFEGEGRIRALFAAGSNPAGALPDQQKAIRALRSLEMLVTSEPRWSETARLAHYVMAPKLLLERPDHTGLMEYYFHEPYALYTPAVLKPEPSSDVIDDWYLYWAIAQKLGVAITLNDTALATDKAPTSDDVLAILASHGRVPYEEVKRHPRGKLYDQSPVTVLAPREGTDGRFDLAPDDVAAELEAFLTEPERAAAAGYGSVYTHRLTARRIRETVNTMGREFPGVRKRMTTNPAHMHPDDIAALGLADGARVFIEAENDRIPAVLKADDGIRPGVISMVHGWGGLPEDEDQFEQVGAATTRLVSSDRYVEAVNAMPRMSAIPVRVRPI